ncbi:RING finger protein 141-like isoform X2 [Oratosquilla oratoria]|uniref:RING finger protein 141-like isoform X2 n=1 Tax=Oratosquilla oratoria TaxID=337810 RepID=UPI003F773EF2
MGQKGSIPIEENLQYLHDQLMTQAGADHDIATTATLTYDHFLSYITKLNHICSEYKDSEGQVLVFAVKKGTDSTIFWKATVRIACVKLHTESNSVRSYRLLNIRQFLQVFRRITYECTGGTGGDEQSSQHSNRPTQEMCPVGLQGEGCLVPIPVSFFSPLTKEKKMQVPPTLAASMVLGGMEDHSSSSCGSSNGSRNMPEGAVASQTNQELGASLEECCICLERKPDVILPCTHAYCLPCIEQWNGVDKTCPVCRESLKSTDDTWVISEVPDNEQVTQEIQRALIGLAEVKSPKDNHE